MFKMPQCSLYQRERRPRRWLSLSKMRRFGSGIILAFVYQIFVDEASHRFTEKEKIN
jgi:hypothetical protein